MTQGRQIVHVHLDLEGLSADQLDVRGFSIEEALDEPYVARVDFAIRDLDADPTALVGTDARLTLSRGDEERRFVGVVRRVWEGGEQRVGEEMLGVVARVEIVPALYLLSLRGGSRIFQEMSAIEVVEQVLGEALGEYGREIQVEVGAEYPTREYCVQYQETDLAFVERLLQEEGVSYGFDHQGDVEVMVLRDDNGQYAAVPGHDTLEFHQLELHTSEDEVVRELRRRHGHATTSVTVRDFDWTRADFSVEHAEPGEDPLGRTRESYEHGLGRTLTISDYDAGARRYQADDSAAQALTRQQAHRRDELLASGRSNVVGFAPGRHFDLVGHPTVGVDGAYLLRRVVHEGRGGASLDGSEPGPELAGDGDHYRNSFEVSPLAVPHRPRRTRPKPSVSSIQTATVTGPAGEEIHTDEHGRVKVRFHWDRLDPTDEKSSCWVRCEQDWAGANWGFVWLPRIGMEVVVTFVGGDADRPFVTGTVYNGTHAPPYPLPDEKTKSTIKSNSSPGGGGYNELRFEDLAGSEEIFTHAQKDYVEVVENDHSTLVHHDQTIEVDNDQTQSIGNDQVELVQGDQDLSVGGDRSVHVRGDFDEAVDGTETRSVSGDVTESFDANETRDIAASVTESIGASETRTIGASLTEDIAGDHSKSIGAASTETISGTLTQTVDGGISTTTPATYNIIATGGFNVTAPAGITMVAAAGVKLIAPGGVTWIDNANDWFGSAYLGCKSHDFPDFCGFKLELGGLQIGTTGAKFEVATIEICNAGNGKKTFALEMLTRGAEIRNGALRKKLKAIICYGC